MAAKRKNFPNLVKNYMADLKIMWHKINGPLVAIYQDTSNYIDLSETMSPGGRACFSYVQIGKTLKIFLSTTTGAIWK